MQPDPKIAAVLILIYPRDGEPHIVFTRRTETVGSHRGQISLPGGRREASDRTLADTALRETEEELGIPASEVEILGPLPEVHVVVSNFLITPYVGALPYHPTFQPNPAEVAEIIEVPVSVLKDPECFHEEVWIRRGEPQLMQFYTYRNDQIWGATGRVILELLQSEHFERAVTALGLSI